MLAEVADQGLHPVVQPTSPEDLRLVGSGGVQRLEVSGPTEVRRAAEAFNFMQLAYLRGLEDAEPIHPINMQALLLSIVEDEQALQRHVSLEEVAPGQSTLAPCPGKLSVFKRAVTNLIDNAVAPGKTVAVRIEDSAAALRIMIDDDGLGVPAGDLARLTEPFVRLDASSSLDTGDFELGLGVAIKRDAAACHGGTAVLQNRNGGGLRAIQALPRSR